MLENLFADYLTRLGISPKTLKNYRSDVSHFTGWLIFKIRTYGVFAQGLSEAVPFLSRELGQDYKNFLVENNVPTKTLNRRLTTIRHLARFFLESQILDFDFMTGIINVTGSKNIKISQHPIILEFQKHLESEGVSKNTIKNYLSDIRQFFSWLERQESVSRIS